MPTTISHVQDDRTTGALALVVALGAIAFANFGGAPGESGGPREFAVSAVALLLVTALVFGRVLPRAVHHRRVALVLAGLSVAGLVAFWSGLPVVLGVAALAAGVRAGGAAGAVASTLGGLAAAAGVAVCVLG